MRWVVILATTEGPRRGATGRERPRALQGPRASLGFQARRRPRSANRKLVRASDRRVEKLAGGRCASPGLGYLETLDSQGGNDLVDQILDDRQRLALVGPDEQVSDAVLTHPAGPADPVDIVLGLIRDVVID